MTNSTDEYFAVDGQSLQTYAYNITTWGGSREEPPALRGSNFTIPGAAGQRFAPKVVDSRVITLSMWVQGSLPDGSAPTDGSARREFEFNYKKLRKLLYTPRRELTLTKRFHDYETGALVTAVGHGQYSGGLNLTMTGRARGVFTVDLYMVDPFFYGDKVTLPSFTTVTQQRTFEVVGDERTVAIDVSIKGARVNPRLTVTNPEGTNWVKYNYSLGSSDSATLGVQGFESKTKPGTGTEFTSAGLVTHGGDTNWLAFAQGTNTLKLDSTSGSGEIIVSYKPVWF